MACRRPLEKAVWTETPTKGWQHRHLPYSRDEILAQRHLPGTPCEKSGPTSQPQSRGTSHNHLRRFSVPKDWGEQQTPVRTSHSRRPAFPSKMEQRPFTTAQRGVWAPRYILRSLAGANLKKHWVTPACPNLHIGRRVVRLDQPQEFRWQSIRRHYLP